MLDHRVRNFKSSVRASPLAATLVARLTTSCTPISRRFNLFRVLFLRRFPSYQVVNPRKSLRSFLLRQICKCGLVNPGKKKESAPFINRCAEARRHVGRVGGKTRKRKADNDARRTKSERNLSSVIRSPTVCNPHLRTERKKKKITAT